MHATGWWNIKNILLAELCLAPVCPKDPVLYFVIKHVIAFESLHLDFGLVHFSPCSNSLLCCLCSARLTLNVSLHFTSPFLFRLSVSPSVSKSSPPINLSKPPHPSTHSHTDILSSYVYFGEVTDWVTAPKAGTMTEREGGEWEGPGKHRELGERERDTEWVVSCYKRECWSCRWH